jgi:RNA polymerase sigma-70 factor (family 1)
MNDHAILTDIAAGDQRAFRQLFDHYAERLTAFAFSIVKSREAAMEVVDEIFVKLWKQRSKAAAIHHIRTYLYTAAKNASLNYLSAKANRQVTEPFDFIDIQLQDDRDPEQQLITSELFSKIRSAVEELPPRCKMIFKLVREDGLRYREVADILNLSINTVDAQMVIAVKRISEQVRGHFDFYPAALSPERVEGSKGRG